MRQAALGTAMLNHIRKLALGICESPNAGGRRPVIRSNFESSVRDLFVIGDLAGASVVKLAMRQGRDVAEQIARTPGARTNDPSTFDVLVVGSGAAGLSAALTAKEHGLRVLVLEQNKFANTIAEFPQGKWVYAEPDSEPPAGRLQFQAAPKEEVIANWLGNISESGLDVRTGEGVTGIQRRPRRGFDVFTGNGTYRARRVILATGLRGNPRRLGVPGEERENIHHQLYGPGSFHDEDILVVGGGNSAVEAALALASQNRVTLSYRGSEFTRAFKENKRQLDAAAGEGRIRVILNSQVMRFEDSAAVLRVGEGAASRVVETPYRRTFVLIGADAPVAFLQSLGLRMENEWTWSRWLCLAAVFLAAYTIYGVKLGENHELWPYRGWGYKAFSFFGRPWSFWYTVVYTAVMTAFGVPAMKRWGIDRGDRFQTWRYASLIGFQWIFFLLIPEFLFQWAVRYEWIGAQLARDPAFAEQAWRSYGLIYAWPLFFYTFFGSPHQIWVVWGVLLSFVILPVLVLFHGKRYCSWVCGCGGLAETLGDRWRHLAPKGRTSIRWERMNAVVLGAATAVTIAMLLRDAVRALQPAADAGVLLYRFVADVWLVGIIPVTLYPFFGGKIWCRYWCPLAKMMEIFSSLFTRLRASRFSIVANERCIACGECSRYCQVGIPVMNFALKQEELNNANSSCIGCGICVTVCPMNVLSFGPWPRHESSLVQIASK